MGIFLIIFTIIGLCLFEVISSADNAIINAEVLSTMKERSRRWFLFWGLMFAVFFVRGLLPWLIVWSVIPSLGPWGALTAAFSNDPRVLQAVARSSPVLLAGGGVFLVFLFLQWLFLEEKNFALAWERFFLKNGKGFYLSAAVILGGVIWFSLRKDIMMAFAAITGSAVFFIGNRLKQNAEKQEKSLIYGQVSDISKILYLEVIDATFSIDGVLGAFAFTMSVPLILLGNGLGAVVVRRLTAGNIERIKKYKYLKNGAMYSILFLGLIMISESFGARVRSWISPLATISTIGYFFARSKKI